MVFNVIQYDFRTKKLPVIDSMAGFFVGISRFFYCYAFETVYVPKDMVDLYRKPLVEDIEPF